VKTVIYSRTASHLTHTATCSHFAARIYWHCTKTHSCGDLYGNAHMHTHTQSLHALKTFI
jgi:hypothetical protein